MPGNQFSSQRWPRSLWAHIPTNIVSLLLASDWSAEGRTGLWLVEKLCSDISHRLNIFQINYDLFARGPGLANIRSQLECWGIRPQSGISVTDQSEARYLTYLQWFIAIHSWILFSQNHFQEDRSHKIDTWSDSLDIKYYSPYSLSSSWKLLFSELSWV